LTPNSSGIRSKQMSPLIVNAEKSENDITYILWQAPSSRVWVTPDMLPRDAFVVSHDEILHDVPLTFCDRKLPSADELRAAASLIPFKDKPQLFLFQLWV
jgi:hypothetical protein